MIYVPAENWRLLSWGTPASIAGPVGEVWLHHGAAGTASLATLRGYERHHVLTNDWAALGYSWAVTDDQIYEGRGWWRVGAHTFGRNAVAYGIVLVGDYSSRRPSQSMIENVATVIRHGVAVGALSRKVLTGGHQNAPGASTSCAGAGGQAVIPDVRALLSGSAPSPVDELEEWFMSLSKQQKDDLSAFASALRAGDKPVSGHQAGTDVRRSTYGRREVDGNPESDARFLSELRRGIGGRFTTFVHLANLLRRLGVRTGLDGNNPTGIANQIRLRGDD